MAEKEEGVISGKRLGLGRVISEPKDPLAAAARPRIAYLLLALDSGEGVKYAKILDDLTEKAGLTQPAIDAALKWMETTGEIFEMGAKSNCYTLVNSPTRDLIHERILALISAYDTGEGVKPSTLLQELVQEGIPPPALDFAIEELTIAEIEKTESGNYKKREIKLNVRKLSF